MAKTLDAHDKLVKDIFSGNYEFEIPDYQRPYAWTEEQAQELFNDLISAVKDADAGGSSSQYFLGSIVLIKNDRETKAIVVDGQQRLTTLTILFAVLRASWEAMDHKAGVKSATSMLYEEGDEELGKATGYRFIAREEDRHFFQKYIQEPGGIQQLIKSTDKLKDSRLHYQENARLLYEKISELSLDDQRGLWQFIANACSIVVISTPDLEAAYRIFSVLNNRGLDLEPIDILKAEILGVIRKTSGADKSSSYAKKWSETEKKLGRDAFGELFGHIRTVYAKQKQRATLVKEFQTSVFEYKFPTKLIDEVIIPYAEVWDYIREAEFEAMELAETINEYLSWLNEVDFQDWVPPALVYFKTFRQKPKLLSEFFKLLERLTYFLLVTKAGINERIEVYSSLTREIESNSFSGDPFALTTFALSQSQKIEFLAALDGNIYRKLPRARMALLLRLEALSSDGSKKSTFNNLSLEHVLPQTPPKDSEWIMWFPDEEERDSWTHRLANLVPLHVRKNPAASNFDFATKKDVYFKGKGTNCPIVLTQEVRDETEWTPRVLEKRQSKLLGKLADHWELR